MPVTFKFSREFLKDVRKLHKRYRFIEEDIDSLKEEMRINQYRGVLVPRWGSNVYKARLTNRSARRGKSGGFRAVYVLQDGSIVLFMHIYSKSDKDDASSNEIQRLLRDLA